MIIGIVGYYASGKDTAAHILEEKGFAHFSLSDMIREEVRKEGREITREYLIEKGNALRKEFGPSVLADKALEYIEAREKEEKEKEAKKGGEGKKNFIITSIRNPFEVKSLRRRRDFVLVFIDAEIRTRFERMLPRARESDPKTYEQFLEFEDRERKSNDPTKQSIDDCVRLADKKIENNGDEQDFRGEIERLLAELRSSA